MSTPDSNTVTAVPQDQVYSPLNVLQGLVPDETLAALQEEANKTNAAAAATQKPVVADTTTTTADEPNDDDEPGQDDTAPVNPKSLLFSSPKPSAGADLKIENLTDVVKVGNKVAGLQMKTESDLGLLFDSVAELKVKNEELAAFEQKYTEVEKAFQAMPAPLVAAMQAWEQGKDWSAVLKPHVTHGIDFSKPVDKQNPTSLVEFYFPGKLTKEQIEAEQKDAVTLGLEDVAKQRFQLDKKAVEDAVAREQELTVQAEAVLTRSKTAAVDAFKTEYSAVDKAILKKIEASLSPQAINDLFLNKDGSLKKESAKRFFFALYGEDEVKELTKRSASAKKTDKNKEAAGKGRQQPASQNGGGGGNGGDPGQSVAAQSIFSGIGRKSVYDQPDVQVKK